MGGSAAYARPEGRAGWGQSWSGGNRRAEVLRLITRKLLGRHEDESSDSEDFDDEPPEDDDHRLVFPSTTIGDAGAAALGAALLAVPRIGWDEEGWSFDFTHLNVCGNNLSYLK